MRRLSLVLLIAFLLSALAPATAFAAPSQPADQNGLSPASFINPDGTLNIPENFSGSFDLRGWDVQIHPNKGVIFSPPQATTGQWSSLGGAGTGLNAFVYDIQFSGGVLYAGGGFTDAGGDADADRIAQFGLPVAAGAEPAEPAERGNKSSKEIATTGTTTFYFGRIQVSVPASAIPPGETNCKIVIETKGTSGRFGFTLNDTVWEVTIVCDSGEVNIFFAPIMICIRPEDGITTNKQIFHRHDPDGSFTALPNADGPDNYVCGTTQVLSLFTLGQLSLPSTGFAPGVVSQLSTQPTDKTYAVTDLVLEIPALDVEMDIVGVPLVNGDWDVSWLGSQAGYLYGTAYPTWAGNSVLTAHVWNADNSAGPFYHLRDLQHGDQVFIHAYGQTYVYEVRSNALVSANNLRMLEHSDYSLVTLITCESFNEASGEYLYRRAVQAVLVSVE